MTSEITAQLMLAYIVVGVVVFIPMYRANWLGIRDYTVTVNFPVVVVVFWPLFILAYLWSLWGKKKGKETDDG